jgi:hydroxymethylpyrimidine pyrophosphatase-like HAD family hydrolase
MAIRCVYTDLDGTMLGRGASLFRDADGNFTLLAARGLEACHRAGAEVVIKSGRRQAQVAEDARLIGQTSYIFEVGCGLVVDGDESFLTGDLQPRDGLTIHQLIEETGAPQLLLGAYAGRLEYHAPWHLNREVSHLMRGLVDTGAANELLLEHGHGDLRLVDNGTISPREISLDLDGPPHAYHLIPRVASKGAAVEQHMRMRGYAPEECVAVGDSREDLGVAEAVGRFFLVRNALEKDPDLGAVIAERANVDVTEERNGEGFYEAVVRSLAEARGG